MPNTFDFTIVTPEQVVHEGEITQVTAPTKDGEITVMAQHTPLVSLLKPGELRIQKPFEGKGQMQEHEIPMAVTSGFIEVRQSGKVVVLADTAQRAKNIDIEAAKEARDRAREILEKKEQERDQEYARAQAELQKELAKIKVANRHIQ